MNRYFLQFESMPNERWGVAPGYSNYLISNFARIFNLETKKFVATCSNSTGYVYAHIKNDRRKWKCPRVSRLVAIVHCPNPDHKTEVNHIDPNRLNNKAENLQWCTHQENIDHKERLRRRRRIENDNKLHYSMGLF